MHAGWILALFILPLAQCSSPNETVFLDATEIERLQNFENLDSAHRVQISEEDEPGEKLWLCLQFVSKTNGEPLPDQYVHFYHTDSDGEYQPHNPNDESTARLNGAARTNHAGQLFVQTILPGAYGSSPNNKHIHTTVKGAHPEGYDIHFKQFTGLMGGRFINRSDQHFLADLKYMADSTLVSFLTIEVKRPQIELN